MDTLDTREVIGRAKFSSVRLFVLKVDCTYVGDLGIQSSRERERVGKQDRVTNSDNTLDTFTARTVASSTIDSNRKTSVLRGSTAEGKTATALNVEWGSHGLRAHNRRVYGRDHIARAYLPLYNRVP